MNVRLVGMLIVGTILILIVIGFFGSVWIDNRAGIKRKELSRLRKDNDLLLRALEAIEEKANVYSDLESVLSTDIRTITRNTKRRQKELNS